MGLEVQTQLGDAEEERSHQDKLSLLLHLSIYLWAFSACGYQGLGRLRALDLDRPGAESSLYTSLAT